MTHNYLESLDFPLNRTEGFGLGGVSGPPVASSTIHLASWLISSPFLRLGFIMTRTSHHFGIKATGWSALCNSRTAICLNLSRTQVASGRPERSAESRNARFSAVVRRISMYSSKGLSFFGRPRLGIELLYQQKRVDCQDNSVIAFANATTNYKTIKGVACPKRPIRGELAHWSSGLRSDGSERSHA